ncbi:PmoA family protein [Phytohabitans rumicis]|uniref:Oxidoreductase n=1 Tax=Phytohabitans rumicis TaxID=1076125 RepID=A0A6V8L3F8_9ACTN|nr:PmoA family protein [Phytohabitans rumicis]GFJ88676.1 oxidoreductase [Phytohabitans rumicis]
MVELRVDGRTVAEYVVEPDLDPTLSPRPYLHPVRTLGGVTVTDVLPEDHRWHLGVSVAVQDVSGTNLWGGRTYVRDAGYTWLDDHGRIVHDEWLERTESRLAHRLRWLDRAGETLLTEERVIAAEPAEGGWALAFSYALTAPADRDIELGSPATNGRPGNAGYGGFFWRLPPGEPAVRTATVDGEEKCHGSEEPWLEVRTDAYTLVFSGLGEGDHWFVRVSGYPGVCAALAWETPLVVPAGQTLRRGHRVLVADSPITLPRP